MNQEQLNRLAGVPFSDSLAPENVLFMERHTPAAMPKCHTHCHIEMNYLSGCEALYFFNGRKVLVPEKTLVIFCGYLPHQMLEVYGEGIISNTYIPLTQFFQWQLPDEFRRDLLSGKMIIESKDSVIKPYIIDRWYSDFEKNQPAFKQLIEHELAVSFQRIGLTGWSDLEGGQYAPNESQISSKGIGHISGMLSYMSENYHLPIKVQDIAEHVGLNRNYSANLFSNIMHTTLKHYLQCLRVHRAQALLLETDRQIADIAFECGFAALSSFYDAFKEHCTISPKQFRAASQKEQSTRIQPIIQ